MLKCRCLRWSFLKSNDVSRGMHDLGFADGRTHELIPSELSTFSTYENIYIYMCEFFDFSLNIEMLLHSQKKDFKVPFFLHRLHAYGLR